MILYLTYNDQPSGVYWSQVCDVVAYLNSLGGKEVRLVALVSARRFRETKRRIKDRDPKATVLPMVPQMKRWRWNTGILAMAASGLRPTGIICRGPFATAMALRMRERGVVRKVCFDGRGAYAAEWEEYRIIDDEALIAQVRPLEQEAVLKSDLRIAVSQALVDHWRERYGYTDDAHVVIPCTLGNDFRFGAGDDREVTRRELGYAPGDLVLVYSGSTAGWQSFGLLEGLLSSILDCQPEVKVLFLSKEDANNRKLMERFPGRVQAKWLDPADVQRTLRACDHGILVREDTITNRVASPTKFAEYLSAGLPVIISEDLGDFSALVKEEGLGVVVGGNEGNAGNEDNADNRGNALDVGRLARPAEDERARLMGIARERFTKVAYREAYARLLWELSA
ncbi:MAG: glycosyltransferase [Flavobacteriales bacterium]|nr:glycosyltransferase [Flavobacteriales bacterium]